MTTATILARARALFALGTLLLTVPAPAAAATSPPWCTAIPLPHAASPACRPLVVRTPRAAVQLAVAATEAQREQGLMGVRVVPARQGMLFAFPDAIDQRRYFWMKNTIAPLDMLFVQGDGTITMIAENVPATTFGQPDDKVARRDGIGRYVIELAAGESERLGLQPGMKLVVPAVPAK